MQRLTTKLLGATLPIVLPSALSLLPALIAGCNQDAPGTSVRVALAYNDALGMDTAEVTLTNRTESAPIAHELLLLVPDDLAGADMPIEVWGRMAGKRAAYGTGTAVPALGKTVTAQLTLTTCTPACQGDMLTTCTGPMVTCALGCTEAGDAHCIAPKPSNGVDPTAADPLHGTTTISADATFDTDTGAILGGLNRAAGTGNAGGVGYVQAPAFGSGGAPLGIFVFHNLTVEAAATVRFTGARAAVLLVGDAAQIAGVIDVTAGRGSRSTPGPGGGVGGSAIGPGQGCGPGAPGQKSGLVDTGGGGAGAGTAGGPGGSADATPFGVEGKACLPTLLEPLQGGSGGGRGSPGIVATPASGGGGGGALQISALGSLEITGTINAGGAGGDGGPLSATDGGSGGGGGSGGAILLESPMMLVGSTAILAANGGGGGGGGGATLAGGPGENASTSIQPAQGGFGVGAEGGGGTGGSFGAGGSTQSPPDVGNGGTTNGGGGGGAFGAIVIRGRARMVLGTISPRAVQADVQPSP